MKNVRWGLLACGGIAGAFAHGLKQTDSGKAMACASRSLDKAKKFAEQWGIPKAYGSYEELLADKDIDAVYISTPHPMHAEWAVKAADAGKHILCEKPLAMNQFDVQTIIEAARRNDVLVMEAFMYRCNPQTAKLVELIRGGAIGQVKMINASFAFQCGYGNLQGRLMNPALGGGGILDVGCYTVSMARLIAGAALGKEVAEPIEVQGMGRIGDTGVDEWAVANLKFPNDIIARLVTGVQISADNQVVIYGSDGVITIPSPWFCQGREAGKVSFKLVSYSKGEQTIEIDVPKGIYALEADVAAAAIDKRQAPSPAMTPADSIGQAATIDKWRAAIGLSYPCETVEAYARPVSKLPLTVRQPNKMPYGELPGVGKKISRLVMGTMVQTNIAHATALFDEFFARGGNAFDTAHIYGGGNTEKLLGLWIKNRNIREQVVVVIKGAHTPYCNPKALVEQFMVSLDRVGTPYADIYMMHRDNPEIPAGEFVDVLNELKAKGLVRAFGGSNWTTKRFEEANAYAAKAGKTPFAALSNNFSLAQMVNPVWAGCVAASEPTNLAWHLKTQTPNLAWSSQARGFFVPGMAAPDKTDDKFMMHCWYSDDNFKRQARCFELAKKKNAHPMSIALAYVLAQKFPQYAMIGPATLAEGVPSYEALDVKLTDAEVKWLNLEQ
ncbi:MAG: aldo/keto reductase [Planctomycetaceae bacterium]|nr:aldo/keto reductase [Planctomycetaceae bacterium]